MTQIVDLVKQTVAADPAVVPQLLQAVADGIKAFQEGERLKRNALASASILTLLAATKISDKKLHTYFPMFIDVAFCQFPTGDEGHTPRERRFWEQFVKEASNNDVDMDWLATTKGNHCVNWWHAYVRPAIVKGKGP